MLCGWLASHRQSVGTPTPCICDKLNPFPEGPWKKKQQQLTGLHQIDPYISFFRSWGFFYTLELMVIARPSRWWSSACLCVPLTRGREIGRGVTQPILQTEKGSELIVRVPTYTHEHADIWGKKGFLASQRTGILDNRIDLSIFTLNTLHVCNSPLNYYFSLFFEFFLFDYTPEFSPRQSGFVFTRFTSSYTISHVKSMYTRDYVCVLLV